MCSIGMETRKESPVCELDEKNTYAAQEPPLIISRISLMLCLVNVVPVPSLLCGVQASTFSTSSPPP